MPRVGLSSWGIVRGVRPDPQALQISRCSG